jgi:hypothetical protein
VHLAASPAAAEPLSFCRRGSVTAMERLKGEDLRAACVVKHELYSKCIATSLAKDVMGRLDVGAPTKKCGALFADINDYCAEYLRTGELLLAKPAK